MDFWGADTWQEGIISGHRWMVLNGQLEDNNDLVEDRAHVQVELNYYFMPCIRSEDLLDF